jgi:GTPase SAR1 family protein
MRFKYLIINILFNLNMSNNNTRHDEDYSFLFKIILVGDAGVGKTHLLSRYIKGSLPKNKFPTIGVEFATKPVPLKTGGTVKA